MEIIRGIVPPIVTPLKGIDELDGAGLERLIELQIEEGVAGLFVLGTTGEGPSLSYRLRYEMVERTCEIVANRIPVLVGVTDTSIQEAVELSRFASESGASAVVAAPPYYFSVGQQEAGDFLWRLADDVALPMFVYNIPPCVKLSLNFATVERLAGHQNICGIKDSAGDIAAYKALLKLRTAREDWTFLIGPELLTAESVLLGGDGGVNGGANLFPRIFVSLFNAAVNRNQREIDNWQSVALKLDRLYSLIGEGAAGYIRGLKCAMSVAGICSDLPAPPFSPVAAADRAKVESLVTELASACASAGCAAG